MLGRFIRHLEGKEKQEMKNKETKNYKDSSK